MTETKQYTVKRWYDESAIYDGDELFAIVDVRMQADKICERLNLLSEENGQLKTKNELLKETINLKPIARSDGEITKVNTMEFIRICRESNEIAKENEQLKIKWKNCSDYNRVLIKENEQLKKELFEARKDYLIETADISDKLYLEDEIEKERKEIFGDNND